MAQWRTSGGPVAIQCRSGAAVLWFVLCVCLMVTLWLPVFASVSLEFASCLFLFCICVYVYVVVASSFAFWFASLFAPVVAMLSFGFACGCLLCCQCFAFLLPVFVFVLIRCMPFCSAVCAPRVPNVSLLNFVLVPLFGHCLARCWHFFVAFVCDCLCLIVGAFVSFFFLLPLFPCMLSFEKCNEI